MAELNKEQEAFYRQVLDRTKQDIENIDKKMDEILESVKMQLAELQNKKKTLIQMYNSAAAMLGVESEFSEEEEEE